ncbi:MAG: hypothetical protein PVSMB1_03470 [Gemmatimonadaceae bacterium]
MEAIIQRLHSMPLMAEATTSNQLLVVFVVPSTATVNLGDKLELDTLRLDSVVLVTNLTRKESFSTLLQKNNVHDLRLPPGHQGSRTPSAARLAGA